MSLLSYLIWTADPEFFTIPFLDRSVRYYGLLFALGFLISQQIMFYMYRKEGKPEKDVETLTVFMIIATIIGARLGHVFFYEPDKYLANPLDILKIWEGGLASHGAAFGILLALWLYTRYDIGFKGLKLKTERITRPGQNWLQVVDRIVIVVALTGCLIRFGNFMNHEIYGIPTNSSYGVVFTNNINSFFGEPNSPIADIDYEKRDADLNEDGAVPIQLNLTLKNHPDLRTKEHVATYLEGRFKELLTSYSYINEHISQSKSRPLDFEISKNSDGTFSAAVNTYAIARHPTQLYESGTSLALFFLLFIIWSRYREQTPPGLLFGIFLILLFGLRFVHELFKENQVAFEDGMAFNMGQILSIPLIMFGIIVLIRSLTIGKVEKQTPQDSH
ncbi:prolipoprotein diacylglyceryl transferase [Fulvivirga sp. RKSG066]|uniref:prolipoprotein diacylglyceryl transferase n=1 Tax=Fulvivirga aurantia TaxID=2529383 RepID=UPI0012BBDA96|nr:prolipoprotein diacylglyceryl transferase [Fulvivirga aurantia]MTI21238.1 prolipoprotein diacylglyceryl transferase [Fulvivirga aurantia]